jgi:HPt (histidine-containing phosphotransfer) domain-containing protein
MGVIDPESIEALREFESPDDKDDLLADLLGFFRARGPERLGAMRSGLENDDAAMIQFSAHALKSSARTLGALRLGTLCAELEQVARGRDLSSAPALVDAIDQQYQLADAELGQLILGE